jgi:hypothetical protein
MTGKAQKQALTLGVLVVVLATVLYYQFRSPSPAGTPSRPSNQVSRATPPPRPASAQPPETDVRLELLQSANDELAEAERNPFRFRPKPPPPPPPRAAIPVRPREVAPPVPTGPPPPPPITMRFIGVVELPAPEGRMAILSDGRGSAPVPGKEGDIIEGRYRLLRVGPDSIEMAYLDGRGRQTIRLSGQ